VLDSSSEWVGSGFGSAVPSSCSSHTQAMHLCKVDDVVSFLLPCRPFSWLDGQKGLQEVLSWGLQAL